MNRHRWLRLFSAKARAIRRADRARDRGAAADAASLYRQVLDRWGTTFGLLVQLGNALKDKGEYVAAERVYLDALALRPDDADVFLQRGHLMKLAGDIEVAEQHYRKASLLDPTCKAAALELSNLHPSALVAGHLSQPRANRYGSPAVKPGMPMAASLIYDRIMNQYRWRRG